MEVRGECALSLTNQMLNLILTLTITLLLNSKSTVNQMKPYPEKFIRDDVVAPFVVQLSVVFYSVVLYREAMPKIQPGPAGLE